MVRLVAAVAVLGAVGCYWGEEQPSGPYDARKLPPDAFDPFASTTMLTDLHGGTGIGQADVWGVVIADFNSDGRPDIAVVEFAGFVTVWLDTTPVGATTPTFSAPVGFAVGISPEGIATADIDGDGRPDLVTTNTGGSDLSVLVNTTSPGAATPSFAAETRVTGIPPQPAAVAAADFNGDGKLDLAVVAYHQNVIVLNTTAGAGMPLTFSAATSFDPSWWSYVATGDFNGDGKPDIVLAGTLEAAVRARFDQTPALATTPSFPVLNDFTTTTTPFAIVVADFNNDHEPDILAGGSLLLDTTPSMSTVPAFASPGSSGTINASTCAGDIDGDGTLDLVAVVTNPCCTLVVSKGLGDGTFIPYGERYLAYPGPLALADFNGDGRQDVVSFNDQTGQGIVVLAK